MGIIRKKEPKEIEIKLSEVVDNLKKNRKELQNKLGVIKSKYTHLKVYSNGVPISLKDWKFLEVDDYVWLVHMILGDKVSANDISLKSLTILVDRVVEIVRFGDRGCEDLFYVCGLLQQIFDEEKYKATMLEFNGMNNPYLNYLSTDNVTLKFEDDLSSPTKNDDRDALLQKQDTGVLPKKSSDVKNKFRLKNLEPKKFLGAMKKYGKYAVMGAGVGMAASVVAPSVAISGVGTIRLAYSAGKLVNNVVSKGFLGGEPTPVDKVVTAVKKGIEDKIGETKFYRGLQRVNKFLKQPKVQWFINGMAAGYIIGNWLDLDSKVKGLFENKQSTTTTVPNETANLQTEATEPTTVPQETIPQETIPQENISTQKPARPIQKPRPEIEIDAAPTTPTPETTDYSWLDVGKDGDKIDLSGMKQGYTDVYAARGAYTGQYEHLNEAVNLVTEYASLDNGTFISEIILPDGKIFTGNVGQLLDSGIDPSQCAANICNKNGDYAWGNLEAVLETLSKASSRSR